VRLLHGELCGVTDGEEKRIRAKLLRGFKKQADGSWKAARAMWNTSE
jgi:ketosteroid isomerase-like protein